MDLHTINSKGTRHQAKARVGRGIGSGNGKTCGRGHKGWGARSGSYRRPGYEGGQMPIYRRVPKRGFTNARFRTDYTIINVGDLSVFADGETVDLAAILSRGLASENTPLLKVLGVGDLGAKITVRAQRFSRTAREKIEAAGGSVVLLDSRGIEMSEGDAGGSPEPSPESASE